MSVLGARSQRLVRLAGFLGLSCFCASAAAAWPPPATTPLEALAETRFWPNDPDYAYGDFNSTKPGQWWLYSFVPARAPAALLLRQPGLASGLSVDAAWRFGLGKPAVVLAIIDDGVDLLEPELAFSVVFNLGELTQAPLLVGGKPCAPLVPADPNSPRFDCASPPDGEVTLEDFREFLGFSANAPAETRYDPNGNGVLDIVDVVQRYQNQRDDDNNGFVDDIVGWNFAEGDGMPLHTVTRHGTECALDAVASTNDGRGRASVCPNCRFIPLRVMDQRGVDPQKLALAILYAATRGVSAALVGHLPSGRSETLERAIQSAAQRGVLVIMPQDGERQNHPPIHLDLDEWLSVGGLTTSSESNAPTLTTSFVALDPCNAFGSGVNYVGAGPSCSRSATSIALGTAGLVVSAAAVEGGRGKPSALELAATLKAASDTIDTTLTSPSGLSRANQPLIRRLNANTAVEWARAGLLPPELGIERPYWYEPIVLNRLKAPTSIIGRLAATRADSLDLTVRIAYGHAPSETDFQTLASKVGITAPFPDGSNLATIDLRQAAPPVASAEAAAGVGRIATLRIAATAKYAAADRALTTTVERKIVVVEDQDLVTGAPLRLGSTPSSPKLADVDGDAASDVVLGTMDGRLWVLSVKDGRVIESTPKPLQTDPTDGFASLLNRVPAPSVLEGARSFANNPGRSSIVAAPALADIDGDGRAEIIATTLDGRIYGLRPDGTSLFSPRGFIELPPPSGRCQNEAACPPASTRVERGTSSSPVVADMNGDGQLDIVVAGHDGQIHAYGRDGQRLAGWPILIGSSATTLPGKLTQSPAVGDFNGDGVADLVVTSGEQRSENFDRGNHLVILGGKGAESPIVAPGWPVSVESYEILVDRLDRSTPGAAVDASTDLVQALIYGNASQPFFLPLNPGLTQDEDATHVGLPSSATPVSRLDGMLGFDLTSKGAQSALTTYGNFAPLLARPSLGDLNRDGVTDLVLPGASLGSLYALRNNSNTEHQGMLGLYDGETGRMFPAAPIALDDFVGTAGAAIADITNDGIPEVIAASGSTGVLAMDACGRSPPGWPKVVGSRVTTTPAVGDIDNDGSLEVVVSTEDGWLYVWRTKGAATSYVPWSSAQNDSYNQSNHRAPATATTPKQPSRIRLDASGRCDLKDSPPPPTTPPPQLSARGGCDCELAENSERATPWYAVAVVLLFLRRPRRRQ